jgi:hypothetical protein
VALQVIACTQVQPVHDTLDIVWEEVEPPPYVMMRASPGWVAATGIVIVEELTLQGAWFPEV